MNINGNPKDITLKYAFATVVNSLTFVNTLMSKGINKEPTIPNIILEINVIERT